MRTFILLVLFSNILFAQETTKSKQLEVQSGVFLYGSDIEEYVPGIHGTIDLNTAFSSQFFYPYLYIDLNAGFGYGGLEDEFGLKRFMYAQFYIILKHQSLFSVHLFQPVYHLFMQNLKIIEIKMVNLLTNRLRK